MIKAILFDLDGVLIDAAEWHYEALNKALGLFGFSISRDDHIKRFNGISTKEKLDILVKEYGFPRELVDLVSELKRKYTKQQVRLMTHQNHPKQMMLKFLVKDHLLACVSNAQKYSVEEMLNLAGIESYFDLIMGNDEGLPNKPSPAMYLEAMRRLEVTPNECIIVEDSKYGIEAAKASGAKVIEVHNYNDVNLDLFV